MKKISQAEFIEKVKAIHGDKYDYSRTGYTNARAKIEIICHKHGSFWQKPNAHLNGNGCQACSVERRSADLRGTTEQFIEKAQAIHGDRYDYSQVQYTNNHTAVAIICRKHGTFRQTASRHTQGSGCPKCATERQADNLRSTTEEFIAKARAVHGDKYDYSRVEYLGDRFKVEIGCREHGTFHQTPASHLSGHGCLKCGVKRQADNHHSSTEQFIEKAKDIHGDLYDYSQVQYTNNHTAVAIICRKHGSFWQSPRNHTQGSGCPKCATERSSDAKRGTAEQFIEKAQAVHGDKYDYSRVEYLGDRFKVEIGCREHGSFWQSPNNHQQGKGCPKCGVERRAADLRDTAEQFIEKAQAVHGDRYDYSRVVYMASVLKVEIVCPKHGTFHQTPASHLSGYGCPKCATEQQADNRRNTTEQFIEKAKDIHGDKYDYSRVVYTGARVNVEIVCPNHGSFWQSPNNHQQGKGCQSCATSVSQPELDILAIVEAAGHKAEHRYRPNWMGGKELDIYVPDLKLAIEYCGTHVHNVDWNVFGGATKPKQYHYDKWKTCRDNGVTLITIYDFLWMTNRDKIVRMLNHKLQKADRRVYARKCEIVELDRATCWDFVKANHIEGTGVWKYSCTYKGLMHKGELVAVMVEQDGDIKRSCTKQGVAVIGGVSRLFKSFPAMTTMMTTNDTGSSGDYGIRVEKFTLRYWWVNLATGVSFTRRACQKHQLESKFGIPVGDLTEVQYMTARGFVRVFDSGLSYFVNRT